MRMSSMSLLLIALGVGLAGLGVTYLSRPPGTPGGAPSGERAEGTQQGEARGASFDEVPGLPPKNPQHLHGLGPSERSVQDGIIRVPMRELSAVVYDQEAAEASGTPGLEGIPASILGLEGRRVAIRGYMMPLEMVTDLEARSFYLTDSAMVCCFGQPFQVQDVVEVTAKEGESVRYVYKDLVEVVGIFHVNPTLNRGFLQSIYQMDCEESRVIPVAELEPRR